MIGHGQRDRGDRHLERHALVLNAAELLVEVEAAVQADGGARLGCGEQVQQSEDVRGRCGHLEAVVGAEAQRRDPVLRPQVDERCVWRTALGRSASRAEDEGGIVGFPHIDGRRPALRRDRSPQRSVGRRGRGRPRSRATRPAGRRPHRRRRRSGVRQADGRADFERLPGGVEHDRSGAELAHSVDRDHEFRAVRRHDRHAVAAAYALCGEVRASALAARSSSP